MQGCYNRVQLRPGLTLHCADVLHLCNLSTQFLIREACVKVLVKLEGDVQMEIGGHLLPLDPARGSGALVTVRSSVLLHRHSQTGTRQRTVMLTLLPNWLTGIGLDFERKQDLLNWRPSRRALTLAGLLLRPVDDEGPLRQLRQESRALELVSEAYGLGNPADRTRLMSASATRRAQRLRELLDSDEADALDMAGMARRMGSNASTLQQQFRATFGQTIFDYLRTRRLQRAAHALRNEGVSVTRAAEIAGYSSQANFSTAFRLRYGMPPTRYRDAH